MVTTVFPLMDEPLTLDLVNTRPSTAGGTVDLLATSDGLEAWLGAQAHRLPRAPHRIMPADLADVLALREHITTAIDKARRGQRPPAPALKALTRAEASAPLWRQVAWAGGTVTVAPRHHGSARQQLLA